MAEDTQLEFVFPSKYNDVIDEEDVENTDLMYANLGVDLFIPMERGVDPGQIKMRLVSTVPAHAEFGRRYIIDRIFEDIAAPVSQLREGATVISRGGRPIVTITVEIRDEGSTTDYGVLGSYANCLHPATEGSSSQRSGRFRSVNDNDNGHDAQITLFDDPNSQGEGQ